MKLLLINLATFPRFERYLSGGEKHLLELCNNSTNLGITPMMLTAPAELEILQFTQTKVGTIIAKTPFERILCKSSVGLAIVYAFRVVSSLTRLFPVCQYEVVVSTSSFLVDIVPAIVASKLGRSPPLAVYVHHLVPPPAHRSTYHHLIPSILNWVSQSLTLPLVRKFARIVFVNPHYYTALKEMGFQEEKLRIMEQGIDSQKIHLAEPLNAQFTACFVGRLTPLKGVSDLIDSWKIVCTKFTQAKLVLIGGGHADYVSLVRHKIEKNGLSGNVMLLGPVPDEQKFSLLKSSQVFVFPSYEEGWAIAVREAMGCGLPVVAYDLPAFRTLSAGMIKVQIGDKDAMSDAVITLLSDDSLRSRIGQDGRRSVNELDWENVTMKEIRTLRGLDSSSIITSQGPPRP